MKFFLTLRHWLVFLLLYITPFAAIFLSVFITVFKHPDDPKAVQAIMPPLVAILMLYVYGSAFLWTYGTGNALYERLPENVFLNIHIFRFMTILPLLWGGWLAFIFYKQFMGMIGGPLYADMQDNDIFSVGSIVMLLFAIHNNWFIAKALKSVERHGEVSIGDYFGDFILVTFLPIGVWLLQPRFNHIAEGLEEAIDDRPDILDTHFR